MNPKARNPELPQRQAGVLTSRMGTFYPGSHVIFRRQDLHRDLKDMDWLELYVFGITGRRFSQAQLRLMNVLWTYTSYPDVRLWNNRVAALAGGARSTGVLGLAAALAVSEASIYGVPPLVRAIDAFTRIERRLKEGGTLDECIDDELEEHRGIGGYGRPLVNSDERIQPTLDMAKSLGLDGGPYLRLAFAIDDTLLNSRRRMRMNYAALVAALGMDIGLSRRELYLLMFPVFLAGMPPCLEEAASRPEGTLYATACADIRYGGVPTRTWAGRHVRKGE